MTKLGETSKWSDPNHPAVQGTESRKLHAGYGGGPSKVKPESGQERNQEFEYGNWLPFKVPKSLEKQLQIDPFTVGI